MLKTPLCDLLGIEVPIILAPMGSATSAEFAAAVSNEGGLGGIGSLFRTTAAIKRDIDVVRELTNRHFAVNHIPPTLDAEAFRYTLQARPAVISFALGDPGDLVRQAHDVGARVILQVTTVAQAVQAAERGVDVIIAQGGEAGGYGGSVSTMALVPQVVDAVSPIPVVAAGGIFDGRGIAAAFMLGAVGVNMGTRFLASRRLPSPMPGSRRSRSRVRGCDQGRRSQRYHPAAGHSRFRHRPALYQYALPQRMERQARGGTPRSGPLAGSPRVDAPGRPPARYAAHGGPDRRRHQGDPARRGNHAPSHSRDRGCACAGTQTELKVLF